MGLQELGYTSWSFQEGVPQTLSPKAEAAGYCATYLLTFSNNATHQRRTDVAIGASAFCAQASDREKSPELQRALAHREADGDLNAEALKAMRMISRMADLHYDEDKTGSFLGMNANRRFRPEEGISQVLLNTVITPLLRPGAALAGLLHSPTYEKIPYAKGRNGETKFALLFRGVKSDPNVLIVVGHVYEDGCEQEKTIVRKLATAVTARSKGLGTDVRDDTSEAAEVLLKKGGSMREEDLFKQLDPATSRRIDTYGRERWLREYFDVVNTKSLDDDPRGKDKTIRFRACALPPRVGPRFATPSTASASGCSAQGHPKRPKCAAEAGASFSNSDSGGSASIEGLGGPPAAISPPPRPRRGEPAAGAVQSPPAPPAASVADLAAAAAPPAAVPLSDPAGAVQAPPAAPPAPPAPPPYSNAQGKQKAAPPPAGARKAVQVPLAELQEATGSFAEERLIGQGGFGRVYWAPRLSSLAATDADVPVAVKLLFSGGGTWASEQVLRSLREEVDLLSKCRHPNLIQLLASCDDPRGLCAVYPLALGGTYEDRLVLGPPALARLHTLGASTKTLTCKGRLRVLRDVTSALVYLHTHSAAKPWTALHGDVKPCNILLMLDGQAVLADVGLAKQRLVDSSRTGGSSSRIVRGTAIYLDPAYMESGKRTPATDGYALGLVGFQSVTGQALCDCGFHTARELRRNPNSIEKWKHLLDKRAAWPPAVAAGLAAMVSRLSEQFPEDRISCAEAKQRLEDLLQECDDSGGGSGGGSGGSGGSGGGSGGGSVWVGSGGGEETPIAPAELRSASGQATPRQASNGTSMELIVSTLKDDCGQCHNCRDKPEYGGPGVKKQACVHRVCQAEQVAARDASTSRYGRLLSRGAPAGSLLNGEWLRVDADLVAHPRYVRRDVDVPELHLFYTGSAWRIVRGSDDPSGELLAEAVSAALHPATVGVSGWSLLEAETGAVRHCPEYEMVCDGPNTELQPFLMEELGRDFFLRVQLRSRSGKQGAEVFWFVCPATGNVYHSAAKPGGPGGRSRPGKRYCHLCAKCFSANNFVSCHLATIHRPGRPTGLVTVPDEAGGVHLLWRPPAHPTGQGHLQRLRVVPGITGYRVRVSVNDGISWQVGINDTGTSEARAIITNLVAAVPYRFQVAAVNCAGVGADSEPSPQLCVAPEHPPTPPPVASRMSDGLDLVSLAAANRRKGAEVDSAGEEAEGAGAESPAPVAPHGMRSLLLRALVAGEKARDAIVEHALSEEPDRRRHSLVSELGREKSVQAPLWTQDGGWTLVRGGGFHRDGVTYSLTAAGEAFREHASAGTPGGSRRAEAGKARRKARGAASAEAAAAALADGVVAEEEWLAEGEYVGEELLRQVEGHGEMHAVVRLYLPPLYLPPGEGEGEPALWRIEHDDGDEEDLEEHEVRAAMRRLAAARKEEEAAPPMSEEEVTLLMEAPEEAWGEEWEGGSGTVPTQASPTNLGAGAERSVVIARPRKPGSLVDDQLEAAIQLVGRRCSPNGHKLREHSTLLPLVRQLVDLRRPTCMSKSYISFGSSKDCLQLTQSIIDKLGVEMLVVLEHGQVLGSAILTKTGRAQGAVGFVVLQLLAVDENAEGRGVGSKLLDEACARAKLHDPDGSMLVPATSVWWGGNSKSQWLRAVEASECAELSRIPHLFQMNSGRMLRWSCRDARPGWMRARHRVDAWDTTVRLLEPQPQPQGAAGPAAPRLAQPRFNLASPSVAPRCEAQLSAGCTQPEAPQVSAGPLTREVQKRKRAEALPLPWWAKMPEEYRPPDGDPSHFWGDSHRRGHDGRMWRTVDVYNSTDYKRKKIGVRWMPLTGSCTCPRPQKWCRCLRIMQDPSDL